MSDAAPATEPLSWRIPPLQTAVLFLVVTALAAWNIYGHPSGSVRAFTILLAVATLAWAVIGMRTHLFVDDEGVAVRYIGRETWLPWADIDSIDVVSGIRGAYTIRLTRNDGSTVDVPPSLLQPARPVKKPEAVARLKTIVARMKALRTVS